MDLSVRSLLLVVATLPVLAGGRGAGGAGGAGGGPAFAARQRTALLARIGDSVDLSCRVLRLADRAVSWVRSSDLQILTHAGAVFTADSRVSCVESGAFPEEDFDLDDGPGPPERAEQGSVHTLRITRLRVSDSGRYECQVNTEPKMSLFFNLTVVEWELPRVEVWAEGGGAAEGAAGGAARLACGARYRPAASPASSLPLAALPPLRIRWTHDGRDLDPQRLGGVSLESEVWAGGARSQLTLGPLRARHAGRYTCRARAAAASLALRVHGAPSRPHADAEDGPAGEMQRDQAEARLSSRAGAARGAGVRGLLALLLLLLACT